MSLSNGTTVCDMTHTRKRPRRRRPGRLATLAWFILDTLLIWFFLRLVLHLTIGYRLTPVGFAIGAVAAGIGAAVAIGWLVVLACWPSRAKASGRGDPRAARGNSPIAREDAKPA
jgi:hypothetical protein